MQTYDWKGRPRISTNQDGTTREAAYAGCGCAGGEVVTMRDEVNRYSKVYHDVVGRAWKTEELNWNQTVYRTTTNSFNALDQVTQTFVQEGSSGTGQTTTLTYDGYARLKTRRLPQNDPNTSTTFDYFADNTMQKVTDARSATTNYVYNNRHQITGVSYGVPTGSSIVVPSPVSFTYDAAGNRTQMTDGFGTQTYQYDQLSRLTSETRSITEINNSYTFNYGYNVGGQLTSISDPADTSRNLTYVYNQAGRLTTVNGNGFGGVTQYASNLQTRAWGALKHLTYGTGSGKNLDNQYNPRMQISRFEVNTIMGSSYQYHPDGRIKFVDDISMETPASDKFDRSYVYDHVGRLIEAKSGTEAHTPSVTTDDRPYRETFGFDEWNNLNARTGRVWADDMLPVSTEYLDNRRQGWTYDPDGRPTLEDTLEHKYDASGRKYWSKDTAPHAHFSPGLTISQGFDGEGQRLKQTENNVSTYLIRSRVVGEVIWEISYGGGTSVKKTGFVYGAGGMLATQTLGLFGNQQIVTWRYQNPVTGSQRGLEPTELDPLGLNAGLAAAEEGPPDGGEAPDLVFPRFGDIMNGSSGCMMNGSMVSCDTVMFFMEIFGTIVLPADNPMPPKPKDLPPWIWHPSGKEDSPLGVYAEGGGDDEIPPLPAEEVDIIDFYDPVTTTVPQDPDVLQGEGNTRNCQISVSFKAGTTYQGQQGLDNGVGTITYLNERLFGLGFTVTGSVVSGGIGHIGGDPNKENPSGSWTIDQSVTGWINSNGTEIRNNREEVRDIDMFVPHTISGNNFSWYDHPGAPPSLTRLDRYQRFIVRVSRGSEYCEVRFFFAQRKQSPGYFIHWGRSK